MEYFGHQLEQKVQKCQPLHTQNNKHVSLKIIGAHEI
jgi:hypothetical protein